MVNSRPYVDVRLREDPRYRRFVNVSGWWRRQRRHARLNRECPPLPGPNGTYALHLSTQGGVPVVELHLTALDYVGFEMFLTTDGLSHVIEYGQSMRLRCSVESGSLDVAWEPLGLMVTRSDMGLPQPELLSEDGSKINWED